MLPAPTRAILLTSAALLASTPCARAQDFWSDTFLLDAYTGSHRSDVARDLSNGGYELSGGTYVDFRDWYTPRIPDITILLLTQLSPQFGVIWGLSTGETAEKYDIAPAFQLGFAYLYTPFENATLSIRATYPFFGRMTEKTCTADYGDLGGIQTVNCRLAADIIPPEETLDYLVNLTAETDARISVGFTIRF